MADFTPAEHFRKIGNADYLEVKWRLVWFRMEHPDWQIETEMISHDTETKTAVFKSTISDSNGKLIATAHGDETIRDFKDYLTKAETKSVGRALAFLGYGTQFAVELDEGDRIVDSPVEQKKTAPKQKTEPDRKQKPAPAPAPAPAQDAPTAPAINPKPIIICTDCGNEITDTVVGETPVKRDAILGASFKKYHRYLCLDCYNKYRTKGTNENG